MAAPRIRWLSPSDPAWPQLLLRARHDAYHEPSYAALEAARLEGEGGALVADSGASFLLLPLVLRALPQELGHDLPGVRDAVSPYGYPGPILAGPDAADPGWLRDHGDALLGDLRARGVCSLFVRLHTLLPQPRDVLGQLGSLVDHGETVWIDLEQPEDEYWAGLRDNHRRVLRRLGRAGYVAALEPGDEALDAFAEIYGQTMRHVGASASYHFPARYFHDLRRALGEQLHLCTVRRDGVLVAGGLFFTCQDVVQYHLGATASAHRKEAPSRLMFDHVRRWAHERGHRQLHLGGGLGASRDPLFHFKAGFSPRRATFSTWRAVTDEAVFARAAGWWEARHHAPCQVPGDPFFPPYRRPAPAGTPAGGP